MRTGMTAKQRDLLLVAVSFTDLSAVKRRPVLVISGDAHNRRSHNFIAAAVTTSAARNVYGVEVPAQSLADGELKVDSIVCADRLYTFHRSVIIKRIGSVREDTFERVMEQLDRALGRQ